MNTEKSAIPMWLQLATAWLVAGSLYSVAGTSVADESNNGKWRYSLETPAEGWQQIDFDDSGWKEGDGGFGTRGTPGSRVGTVWKSNDIWMRKSFNIGELPKHPGLLIHHDEDAMVFINGVQVLSLRGYVTDYEPVSIPAKHIAALKNGENLLAVHCHQTNGGQFIDVLFADADKPPVLPLSEPFKSDLITSWGSGVTPQNAWTEYPRPQMRRDEWQNLNGMWSYAVTPRSQTATPTQWDGQILVPFCLESKLGSVGRLLGASDALWYQRHFDAPTGSDGTRTLLNFEAVDYRCEVIVNGQSVGKHQGGSTPFALDISQALLTGKNELVVRVEDATEEWQLNGKQRRNPAGIFYTQVSGIWQTVWLERVAPSHISNLSIQTDAESGTITIQSDVQGKSAASGVRVVIKDGATTVAEVKSNTLLVQAKVPAAKLWSPESPHLYQIEISLLDSRDDVLDRVVSYAGIRTIGKQRDAAGHLRMTLNGQIIFNWGPLDQGWWPDGLLTPPSDEAMLFDIEWLKSAGFNMIRKHIKVEPRRYYYHCDRLGMMVWQDQVSGGKNPKWTFLEPDPQDAEWSDDHHKQFMLEFERMVEALENHPCIVVWGPFNEAWGQHRTMEVGKWIVARDPSRLVNIASGGNFWPVGDIADRHNYPDPSFPFDPERYSEFIKVVGEFGGHGYPVVGHLWDAERDNWGYGGLPKTMQEYRERYVKSLEILNQLRRQGVAAGVYTQTTDVEGEINGLMTYDRKVMKIPAVELRELHQILFKQP